MSNPADTTTVKVVDGQELVRYETVTLIQVLAAFEAWDQQPPEKRNAWLQDGRYSKAVKYNGKCYPLKPLIKLAINEEAYLVERTQTAFKELGFEIIAKSMCLAVVELGVQGYRSLVDVSLPLRPLTVMIGPNGSGKTALLELFQLLKEAAQEKLTNGLEKLGGLNGVLSKIPNGPDRLKVDLAVDIGLSNQEPLHYRFELAPRDVGYVIPLERLEWPLTSQTPEPYIKAHYEDVYYADPTTSGSVRPTWDYHHSELALAQVPRMYAGPEALRHGLSQTNFYSFLDVRRRSAIRLPQALIPATRPDPNGENLYAVLYNLRTSYPDSYAHIEEVLQSGFPGFAHLEFPVVGAGQVTMAWYEEALTAPLYPGELSEGSLRFLWLATILLSPANSPLMLIDEPEVSLHPELLKLLAELLQDAATRQQIIVATHSPDLIRWLQPAEIVVLDKEQGQTQFTWADSLDLAEWLKEYTLGELWLTGTLGGRP